MVKVTGKVKVLGGMETTAPSPRVTVVRPEGLTICEAEATAVPTGVGVMVGVIVLVKLSVGVQVFVGDEVTVWVKVLVKVGVKV